MGSGGGTLSAASTLTGSTGQTRVRWTLGPAEGPQSASASVSGVAPVAFTATGAPNTSGSGTMTAAGGAIGLPDGTRVVFPAGAVSGTVQVTLAKGNPATFLDGITESERVLITVTASVAQFAKPVEIRVPLPAAMTLADSSNLLVARIDSMGVLDIFPAAIRLLDGKPYAVVETASFSNWLFEWFFGKTPPAKMTLPVPFYSQGDTHGCWAAGVQMITQAVKPSETDAIPEIIGDFVIDVMDPKGGFSELEWRVRSNLPNLIGRRTGVKPNREMWLFYQLGVTDRLKLRVKHLIGLEKRPVLFFPTWESHSVVLVGYDGDTFFVHDSQAVDTLKGYTARPWSQIVAGAWPLSAAYLVTVPAPIAVSAPVSVNIIPLSLSWIKPKIGAQVPEQYLFYWDHTFPRGYSFRIPGTPTFTATQTLPGEVATFSIPGSLQVINGSPTADQDLTYVLQISAVGMPDVDYTHTRQVTVPYNRNRGYVIPPITIDTFRYNTTSATEYSLTATVSGATGVVAGQTISFSIASVTPELSAVVPDTAAVGHEVVITGRGFGRLPYRNGVLFNGVLAAPDDIRSWKDDTIRVKVPAGATTGPLTVRRGTVPSNALPFTVSTVRTLAGNLERTNTTVFWGPAVIRASGTWSFEGINARIAYSDPELNYLSLRAKVNAPIELRASGYAAVEPLTWTQLNDDGSRVEYTYRTEVTLSIDNREGPTFSKVGTDQDFTLSFTMTSLNQWLAVDIWVNGYSSGVSYRADGTVESTFSNVHAGGVGLAAFYIMAEF